MLGICVQVGATDGAQAAAVLGAEELDRQILGDQVAHPALEVDLVGDDVGLFVLVFTRGARLPVPHVLDPARVHRQGGVRQAALARAQDVRAQLDWLVHKRFIVNTPFERLQHVPRYLKAINLRIEKLRSNPARDAQCMAQMQPLTQALQKLRQAQQGRTDPRVDEFAWLLQELRVSLFAQELKTPVIVSVKRLEKMLAAIRG